MKMVTKSITGGLAAILLTTAIASPAEARHRRHHRGGSDISLGDVVLGTIIVGGAVAAIGALSDSNRYDRGYRDRRYGSRGYGDDRQASVEACAYEAEREVGRRYGGQAQVRDIDDVDRSRDGYRVRGTVEVQPDYRYGRDGYGRGDYGRDRYDRGDQRVRFSCSAYNGRVTGLNVGSNYAYGY